MAATLDQIVDQLKEQNNTLTLTKEAIQKMLAEDVNKRKSYERDAGKREEAAREERNRRSRESNAPRGFKAGLVQGAKEASGFNLLESIGSWGKSILAGLFGGATAGAIAGGLGALVSKGAIFGGAAYLVGKFGEDLFGKLFDWLDPNAVTLKAEDRAALAASMSDALSVGLVGLIFGKKAGIAAFIGSLVGDGLGKLFNLSDTERMKMFGIELPFSEQDFATYGSMIAAYFGPSLISNALSSQLGSGGGPTVGRNAKGQYTKLKPSLLKSFKANFVPRLGWAAVIAGTGSLLANYIADSTGSEELGDVASWVGMGMSIASMFGPTGMLVGAIAGFAVSGGYLVLKWMTDFRNKNMEQLKKEIDALQNEAQLAIEKGNLEEARDILRRAEAKNLRLTESNRGAAAQAEATESAKIRFDISSFAKVGERRQAALSYFEHLFADENLTELQRLTEARKAVSEYAKASAIDQQEALNDMLGALGFNTMASSRAMGMYNELSAKESFSSRLDTKGLTPQGEKLSDYVGGAAGAVIAPTVIDQSTKTDVVKVDNNIRGVGISSARDSVNYNIQ